MLGSFTKTLAAALLLFLFGLAPAIGAERLRIGVDPGYPPFSEIDEEGRLKGFDIDIALALCARMATACSFVRQDWEGLIPGLRAGKFDAIVSSMSITVKRRRLVAFTDRYYSNRVRFVARKGAGFDPAPAGWTVGAVRATIASDWLEENLSKVAAIRLYPGQEKLVRALVEGRVDAVFGDALGFWNWLGSPEGAASTKALALPCARRTRRCAAASTGRSGRSSPTAPMTRSTHGTFPSASTSRPALGGGSVRVDVDPAVPRRSARPRNS